MYPSGDGVTFDHDYYRDKHMPRVIELLGPALRKAGVDRGVAGGDPDGPPPYLAIAYLEFDSVEAFQAAMGPHAGELAADAPNYTNATAVLQISAIAL
jgi:uncharacterized protein (TIGR02118 family)